MRQQPLWKSLAKTKAIGAALAAGFLLLFHPFGGTGICDITGNINRRGEHIYHVPGGEYYDRTFMNPLMGERCLCGEEEFEAAGWPHSLR